MARLGGELSTYKNLDLDETAKVVKAAPGAVYGVLVTNRATSTRYIHFYDATTATTGTTVPLFTWGIPGNTNDDDMAATINQQPGISFPTGICVSATTGFADNDTGAPSTNDVVINIFYK